MSKSHPHQWTIGTDVERPDPALVAELAGLATTQVADCGGPVGVLGPGIRRLAGDGGMCGPVVTVWTKPGDILFVLKSPDLVRPGDVVVIDGAGHTDAALIGDIIGGDIRRRGGAGLVVDGAVRDLDDLVEVGIPVFARGTHPATRSNEGPGALNVAVQCGGVAVGPGDIVRADGSGVVVTVTMPL
jgi:regulator of RNase E activity RraA